MTSEKLFEAIQEYHEESGKHTGMMGVETLGLEKEFTNDLDSEEQLEALFPQETLENVDIFGATEDSEDDDPNPGKFPLFITKGFCKHFKMFV